MRYEEKTLSGGALLLIVLSALAIYMPWHLGLREFYWHEDFFATQVLEKTFLSPIVTVHGAAVPRAYPLFPMLGALLHTCLPFSLETLLRMISLFFTGGIAVLCATTAWAARRNATAVMVACACFISTCFVVEKSPAGYPDSMAAFGILAGQWSYFMLGARNGEWNKAMLSAFFFASVAFLTGGIETVLYLLLPLAIMKRPLDVRNKLSKSGAILGLGLLLLTVLWYWWGYFVALRTMPQLSEPWGYGALSQYPLHVLTFPFVLILRTLPWSLLSFAPFCVALRNMDDTPVFSGFLRRSAGTTFFILWLTPDIGTTGMFVLIAQMSLLIGMNYQPMIRRYGSRLHLPGRFFAWCAVLTSVATLAFFLIPDSALKLFWTLPRSSMFRYDIQTFWQGMLYGGSALLLALYCLRRKAIHSPLWLRLLFFSVSIGLCYQAIVHPFLATGMEQRHMAARIRRAMKNEQRKEGFVLHKDRRLELYGECTYLGESIQMISDLKQLPKNAPVVYYLSEEFPQHPERIWRNLLPPNTTYHNMRLALWRGELAAKENGR